MAIMGQLLYGTLLLRIGPRVLMTSGALVAGTIFMQLGKVHELWLFYLCYMLLLLGNGAYGGIVANTVVNNWFIIKRGKAIGLATAGMSFSGAVIPFIALLLIERTGMQSAFFWLGLAVIMIAPLAFLIMRGRPEECGLTPDGIEISVAPPKTSLSLISAPGDGAAFLNDSSLQTSAHIWTPGQVLRIRAFWHLGFSYGLTMVGVVGVLSQLKPRFTDIGFGDHNAMLMLTLTTLLGALGKYVWGMFCDRYHPQHVVAVLMLSGAVSLLFSFFEDSVPLLVFFVITFGFSMGGVLSTFPIMIASLFGRDSFASVGRILALFFLLQLLGYPIAGASFDFTGSYRTAYVIFIILDFIAAAMIYFMKSPQPALNSKKRQ